MATIDQTGKIGEPSRTQEPSMPATGQLRGRPVIGLRGGTTELRHIVIGLHRRADMMLHAETAKKTAQPVISQTPLAQARPLSAKRMTLTPQNHPTLYKILSKLSILLPGVLRIMTFTEEQKQKMREIQDRLTQAGYSHGNAKAIAHLWVTGWHGCAKPVPGYPNIYMQTHGITGLKVHRDEKTGQMVGDIGIETIATGGSKRYKGMLRIQADGTVSEMGRHTVLKTTLKPEAAQSIFDINAELASYERLVQEGEKIQGELSNEHLDDHIVHVRAETSHIGKAPLVGTIAQAPTRYVSERGQGFQHFLCDENKRPHGLPEKKRMFKEAMHAYAGIGKGLRFLHARGMVHKDIKTDNMVVVNGEGKIIDFGEMAGVKDKVVGISGTPDFFPPELTHGGLQEHNRILPGGKIDIPSNDPRMDMYSFGTALLEFMDPQLCSRLKDINAEAHRTQTPQPNPLPNAKEEIGKIQQELRRRGGDPWALIADLISYDPNARPDSTQAEQRLRAAEALDPEQVFQNPSSSA